MNLKEAFRYQNKLQSFLDEAQGILDRDSNVTRVENTYLRHKVMAEAEDETVLAVPETEYYEGHCPFPPVSAGRERQAVRRHPQGKNGAGHRHGQRGQPQCDAAEHCPHV